MAARPHWRRVCRFANNRDCTRPGKAGGEVMRTPDSSEASIARINGILIWSAIVVAIAATIVLPLFG